MNDLITRDLRHLWHPCTQMKDHEAFPPIAIGKANASYLYTQDGNPLIDAISSWWCKSLGHRHPRVRQAVTAQMEKFEHIIIAGTTNDEVVELCEKLTTLMPAFDRVFFADNGSTGVEVAMKMALQFQAQTGNPQRQSFAALENGYHGETILTLAAGDADLYSAPYKPLMPSIPKIGPLPWRSGPDAQDWNIMSDQEWRAVEESLCPLADSLAAVVFEPIVQGAGNMKIYSPDLLRRLRSWADAHGVLLIADEIMTGLGRTGATLACDHAGISPDFAVLSKALTAGWLPMSVVLTSSRIYEAFYDDYGTGRAFMHSNTYCGNALAVAATLEALTIYEDENTFARVHEDGPRLAALMQTVADNTGALRNVRGLGFVAAADLINPVNGRPWPAAERRGVSVYHEAVARGAWLRPLGDTIYFLPPLNTPWSVLEDLAEIAEQAVRKVCVP